MLIYVNVDSSVCCAPRVRVTGSVGCGILAEASDGVVGPGAARAGVGRASFRRVAAARRCSAALGVALVIAGSWAGAAGAQVPARPLARSVEDLIQDLGHFDARARESAARTLGKLGDRARPAVDALASALADEDHGVRHEAARALRVLAPEIGPAIPALVRALDDRFSDVQIEAAYALGAIGPGARDAVPALIRALGDRHARMAAAWALGNVGPGARDALVPLERLRDGESDPAKRTEIEWAIERVRWRKPARGAESDEPH